MLGTLSAVRGFSVILDVPRAASAAGGDQRPSWRHHGATFCGPRLAIERPPSGGFSEFWRKALAAGFALLPMTFTQDGEKLPAVCYGGTRPAGAAACERWAARFPEALLACRTALSGLTVVDLDTKSPDLLRRVVARCGEPRIIVSTPKGWHCYYRGGNHPRYGRDLPGFEGEPIDVRSSSAGDLVILPGSWTPAGFYRFHRGGWSDFADLTEPASGSLDKPAKRAAPDTPPKRNPGGLSVDVLAGELVPEGQRSKFLFGAARDLLTDPDYSIASVGQLIAALHQVNAQWCDPPSPGADVERAAGSAWRYKAQGRCRPAYVLRPRPTIDRSRRVPPRVMALGPAAADLWLELRMVHGRRPGGFRVVVQALAKRMKRRPAYVQAGKRALIAAGEMVQHSPFRLGRDRTRHAATFAFRDSLTAADRNISFPGTQTEQGTADGSTLPRLAA